MKEKIVDYLSSLSSRERNILLFFVFFIMLFLMGGISWYMNSMIEDKKIDIVEMQKKMEKITSYKTVFKKAKQEKNSMLSRLKRNTTNINTYISQVKESIGVDIYTLKQLKPEKKGKVEMEKVELNLRRMDLADLLAFVYAIENRSRFVFIEDINIKRSYNKKSYSAQLVVATVKEVEEE